MNKKRLFFLIFIVFFLFIVAKIYYDTNYFKINRVGITSERIPQGAELSILQLTDLHNKVFGKDNDSLVESIKDLNADIIVITGDVIHRKTDDFTEVFELLDRIKDINKHVYFVSGNHEWDNPRTDSFFKGLEERNIINLDNKNIDITVDKTIINLIGVADFSTNHDDIEKATENLDIDNYSILLSHAPSFTTYRHTPAELTLSGHTHGGQVRLPFIGALVAPDQGFFPKLEKGTYSIDKDKYLYIDSGLGTSMLPIRFLNQSQMTLIKLSNG